MENSNMVIPYVKPVRIGNFKLWRTKLSVSYVPSEDERRKVREDSNGARKAVSKKYGIEALCVSNLDGTWKIQIPSTMTLFSVIVNSYATVDKELRDRFIGMILTNVYNVGTSASEALHDGFFLLSEMMSYPYLLLPEKEMVRRMEKGLKEAGFDRKRRNAHISEMVDYRRQLYDLIEKKKNALIENYERQQAERRSKEEEALEQLRQDDIAEQALDVLDGQQGS